MRRVVPGPTFEMRPMNVLAYHITWGTYGTRLHGDPRGTVDRAHNEFGTPALGFDEERWEREKENLNFPPVIFTRDQMRLVESLILSICERGYWNTSPAPRDRITFT